MAVLHEGEAVNIAHVGFAIGPQQIKAAHHLFEGHTHLPGDQLLLVGEDHGVADLFPFRVPLNLTV